MSFLVNIDSSVDSSVGFQGSEHSSFSALVTECSLSWSVCTWTSYSGKTRDGTTSTPWLCRMSHTCGTSCGDFNTMDLSSVFVKIGMNLLDDIGSNRSSEDYWEGNWRNLFCFVNIVDVDLRSGSHFFLFFLIFYFVFFIFAFLWFFFFLFSLFGACFLFEENNVLYLV